jgi:hypothetical protein
VGATQFPELRGGLYGLKIDVTVVSQVGVWC